MNNEWPTRQAGSDARSAGAAVLRAEGLCKSYPSGDRRIEILSGVDFSVSVGESVSIRGESGSGKSTLLNLLAGLDSPDAGHVWWLDSNQLTAARRQTFLGIVFQSFYLLPELDARDNVLLAARIRGPIDAAARERAETLLARVGLAARGHHLPAHLSGGERQRVAVARALMNRPQLLLADEPTGNLDEKTAHGVIDLLLELAHETGTALILVTHNATHAARTRRQWVLHEGRLQAPA